MCHKVQFLDHSSLVYTPRHLVIYFLLPQFPTTFMQMIHKYIFLSKPPTLPIAFLHFPLSLTLSTPGSLQTACLLIPPKQNILLLVYPSNALNLLLLLSLFKEPTSLPLIQLAISASFLTRTSLKQHISSICKTSYFHIRQIRQVRSSLDTNSAIVLANSLVFSKLDYCNSLYYNLPAVSLDRLQRVQNALAGVVVPSVRRHHHIAPTLNKLHWLPIQQRIDFKIASLTFKILLNSQPSYLLEFLNPYIPSRNLRSLDKHLLTVPDIRSEERRVGK